MEKKRKILISLQHLSGLFQVLTFKFKWYINDDVILFVNKKDFHKTSFSENLVKEGVFFKIISPGEPPRKIIENGFS